MLSFFFFFLARSRTISVCKSWTLIFDEPVGVGLFTLNTIACQKIGLNHPKSIWHRNATRKCNVRDVRIVLLAPRSIPIHWRKTNIIRVTRDGRRAIITVAREKQKKSKKDYLSVNLRTGRYTILIVLYIEPSLAIVRHTLYNIIIAKIKFDGIILFLESFHRRKSLRMHFVISFHNVFTSKLTPWSHNKLNIFRFITYIISTRVNGRFFGVECDKRIYSHDYTRLFIYNIKHISATIVMHKMFYFY